MTTKRTLKRDKSVTTDAAKQKVATLKVDDDSKTAGLTIERMQLKQLKPHPRNPRRHPKAGSPEWNVLEASLQHDYFDPLVWNKRNGMLVSGHLRTKVFKHLGFTHADVVVVDYDEPTHLARLMAANKSIGEDDLPQVAGLLSELQSSGFNLDLAGFTIGEVDSVFNHETSAGDEAGASRSPDAPAYTTAELKALFGKAANEEPDKVVKRGEVWRVNDNILVCADILRDGDLYMPYYNQLKKEFPKRKILFIPIPDPVMIGVKDKSVACLMVQPSAHAAGWGLTFLAARDKKSIIKKLQ
jgi:hypothetical protein